MNLGCLWFLKGKCLAFAECDRHREKFHVCVTILYSYGFGSCEIETTGNSCLSSQVIVTTE